MKPKFLLNRRNSVLSAFSSVIAFAMTLSGVQGAPQTWAGPAGGTWDNVTTNWDAGVVWGPNNDAVFGVAGVGTVNNAGVSVHNITFNNTGFTIAGGFLTLTGSAPTINTGTGVTATISSAVAGTAGLAKTGAGTLILGGTNSYTGGTTITAGTLFLSGTGPLGITANTLSVTGGTLDLGNTNQTVGATTLGGSATIQSTVGTRELTTSGVTVNGTGNTIAASTFVTGTVAISAGATLDDNGSLTGSVTVAGGGTLSGSGSGSVSGTTGVTGGTINGSGLNLIGLTTFNGAGNILSGTVNSTNGVTLAAGAGLALNGALTGTLAVGSGTLTGTGGSVSGVTTLAGGTINLTSGTLGSLSVAGGSWSGNGSVTGAVTSNSGTFTIGAGANLTANGGLNVTGGSIFGTGTITGNVNYTSATGSSFGGVIAGAGKTLTMNGPSVLILTGVNTYTGATTITSGTLQVDGTLAAGSTVNIASGGSLTGIGAVTGSATLTGTGIINKAGGTIVGTLGVTGGSWNGNGSVGGLITATGGTFAIGAGANLTASGSLFVGAGGSIASGNSASTITGSVNYTSSSNSTFGGVIAGVGNNLTMDGTGSTLTLTGVNTYTGPTQITLGTLQVDGSLAAGSNLVVHNAGTLTGIGTVNGNATLEGNGVINKAGGSIVGTLGVTGGNWNGSGSVGGPVTSSSGTFTIGTGADLTANGGLAVTGGSIAGTGTITGNVNYTSAAGSTFDGVIAGGGKTLTVNSPGVLTLTGASTYTGATTITAGTLRLDRLAANNTTILTDGNTATTSDILISGGTLEIAASEQIAKTGSVNMSSGALNFGSATGLTQSIDHFTNSGGVFTTGANTLHGLGATLTWAGGTNTVSDGGLFDDAHIVISGGTNTVNGGATGGVLRVNAGGLGLEMSNGATLTLNSDNTVAGKLLLLGDVSTSGNTTVTIANSGANTHPGTVDLGAGTRMFTVADGTATTDMLVRAVITNGGLTKAGAGTLALNAANTYTGATTINAGTLDVEGSTAAGSTVAVGTAGTLSGAGTINGNATLTGNGVIDLTDPGSIQGNLDVTGGNWNGQGKVVGTVTASSGTLTIGPVGNLDASNSGLNVTGTGSIVAANSSRVLGGNVNYTSSSDSTFIGVIAGIGKTLTMNAPGATLTLTGTNTYTGTTTVSAGTLKLARGAADNSTIYATPSTSDIIINGGTLEIAASEQIPDSHAINMSSGFFNFGATSGLTETIGRFTNSGGTFVTGANTLHGVGTTIIWSGGTNTVSNGGLVADAHIVISGGTNTVEGGGVLRLDAPGMGLSTGLELFNGGTLTLKSDNAAAGKLLLLGNVNIMGDSTANIISDVVNAHLGTIDLNGGTRTFMVADGASPTDLYINAVITNGALTKDGAGTLFLSGTHTYTGLTTVTAGTLAATGSIAGSLVNSGAVAPGGIGTIGTFTVNGNFTNNPGGTIAIDAGGASHDLLAVTGTAHLGGNLTVTRFGSQMTLGQTIQVIQAGTYDPQGIVFTANNFADLIGFNPATGYITDAGAASYTKASRTLGNLNTNQTAVYLSLYDDAYNLGTKNVFITQTATDYTIIRNGTILNGNGQLVNAELNVEAGAFNAATVNHLSPEVHRGMVDYTEQSLRTHVREGVDAAPISQVGKTQVFATLHTSTAGAKDAANNASYDTEMNGATVGVRYDITKDFQIGGLVGADEGSIKGAMIHTDAVGTMFGAFGRYVLHEATKTTLTGSLSYGSFSYDATRESYGGSAKADGINSDAFEMSLGVRTVSFESGGLRLIPNASVRYLTGSVDGFVENSGPGAKLRVGSQEISSMQADLGVDIEYKVMDHLTLLGNVSYVTDFLDGNNNISAKFAASGVDARGFTVTAPGVDDQGLVLSLGAQYDINDNARIGLHYRNEFHQSSRDAQTFGIGASFGF